MIDSSLKLTQSMLLIAISSNLTVAKLRQLTVLPLPTFLCDLDAQVRGE